MQTLYSLAVYSGFPPGGGGGPDPPTQHHREGGYPIVRKKNKNMFHILLSFQLK